MGKHKAVYTGILIAAAFCLLAAVFAAAAGWLPLGGRSAVSAAADDSAAQTGYAAAVVYGQDFLAVGSGGRIDRITAAGEARQLQSPTRENLTCVWTDGTAVLAGGARGTLLRSTDGETFTLCDSGTQAGLSGITRFGGTYFACGAGGVLLASADGESWDAGRLDTGRDLIAVAASDSRVMALTAETDIFLSTDGAVWTRENFNETYDGLYPAYVFAGAAGMGDVVFILGRQAEAPGAPLVLYTDTGEVWLRREVTAINGEDPAAYLPLTPGTAAWCGDQLLFLCDGGRLLVSPECASCNRLLTVCDRELYALACTGDRLLAAGEDFYFDVLDSAYVRQEKISAEQALADVQNGAILVDVREASEREADGYIPGSLHIPLGQVAETLAELVPDTETELIFYCAKGIRAQKALETAQTLGYDRVYNLGGLGDWPYDITK